ncbi:hypothetical protein, partial [Salmonella enterica]|uniref:hypothetical protein n=1 Tax=Salmonella enterica TaxID=28901 RepID=UPI002EC3FA56|nr:hypothetical protein [Salmonella enterica subsp. enterica serovar Paratyphi A]
MVMFVAAVSFGLIGDCTLAVPLQREGESKGRLQPWILLLRRFVVMFVAAVSFGLIGDCTLAVPL